MKDYYDILWSSVRTRVREPFTGAFILAWVGCNWKAILYIIYPMSWDLFDRLDYINGNLYAEYAWLKLFIGPLALALTYLLVLTKLFNLIDRSYTKDLVRRRVARIEAQGSAKYTANDFENVSAENRELQRKVQQLQDALSKASGDLMTEQHARSAHGNAHFQQLMALQMENAALKKRLGEEN